MNAYESELGYGRSRNQGNGAERILDARHHIEAAAERMCFPSELTKRQIEGFVQARAIEQPQNAGLN